MRFFRVDVGTIQDREGRRIPESVIVEGRRARVAEILDQWQEGGGPGRPEVAYFKVRCDKGRLLILRYAKVFDAWAACEAKGP
jgi:hypothetical protein